MIKKIRYNDEKLNNKYTYKYDNKGNLIEESLCNDREIEVKYVYKYKYDKKDNWIERIEYKDDIPKIITEREIKYW